MRRRLARPMSAYADVRLFTRPRTASPSAGGRHPGGKGGPNLLSGLVFEREYCSRRRIDFCGTPGSWNPASGGVMFLVGLMAGSTLDLSGRQPMDGRSALPGWQAPTTTTATETRNRLVRSDCMPSNRLAAWCQQLSLMQACRVVAGAGAGAGVGVGVGGWMMLRLGTVSF